MCYSLRETRKTIISNEYWRRVSGGNSYDEFRMKTGGGYSPLEIPFGNYETLEFPWITLFKLKYNELVTKLKRPYSVDGRRCARCRTCQSVNFDLSPRVVRFVHRTCRICDSRDSICVRVCICALVKSRKPLRLPTFNYTFVNCSRFKRPITISSHLSRVYRTVGYFLSYRETRV